MERVVLTGAAGFLGGAVLHALKACGHGISAVVRHPESIGELWQRGILEPGRDQVIAQELTRRFALPRLLEGASALIHAAGSPAMRPSSRRSLFADNVEATAYVLEAAQKVGMPRTVVVTHFFGLGAASGTGSATEEVEWALEGLRVPLVQSARLALLEALRHQGLGLDMRLVIPTCCVGSGEGTHRTGAGAEHPTFWQELRRPLERSHLPAPAGGINLVPVERAAWGIVRVLEGGSAGSRYLIGGANLSWERVRAILRPGLRLGVRFPAPDVLRRLAGRLSGLPVRISCWDGESAALYSHAWTYDDQEFCSEFKPEPLAVESVLRLARL